MNSRIESIDFRHENDPNPTKCNLLLGSTLEKDYMVAKSPRLQSNKGKGTSWKKRAQRAAKANESNAQVKQDEMLSANRCRSWERKQNDHHPLKIILLTIMNLNINILFMIKIIPISLVLAGVLAGIVPCTITD